MNRPKARYRSDSFICFKCMLLRTGPSMLAYASSDTFFSQYYFEGRFDIVKFAKLVAAEGLFLFLRIGPYACAEWNFGSVYIFASNCFNVLTISHLATIGFSCHV